MKKQNVLIVHNSYKIPGGEDSVVCNEKKLLESHGHKVFLYTRNNDELDTMTKWQKLRLPFTMLFSLKTYREVKQIIKTKKIDIVHVHNTLVLVSPSVYYAAKSMKIPAVQTIHNFRLLCPGAAFYREGHVCEKCMEKGLSCAVKYGCYRESKIQTLACVICARFHRMTGIYGKIHYICLTDFNREKLLHLKKIRAEQVDVKPNFVQESSSEIVSHDRRKNQIVYVGRLEELKGIDVLFSAWGKRKKDGLKLIVCGMGPMEEWCREYITSNHLADIEMRGFVPNEEVKKIIGESKAIVLPTQWYEGFPVSIVEAYSVGTPVIGSALGNVGSLVEEAVTGVTFNQTSSDDLLEKIEKILTMELEESAYHVYCQRYTAQKNYEQLMTIYDKLSEGKSIS
jgi:glycosyltransferase involved in cell wall biosynthesis